MLKHLEAIVAAWDTPQRQAVFDREFAAIKPISIDYAVMEHATDVAVIEAPFEWDDLGGWQSLARLAGSDENGNTILGKHLGLNTTGTIVRTDDDHLVVTLGLKGLHRRPHAQCHARGEQARRRADSADRQRTRIARMARLSVTANRIQRIAGIDYGTVRIGIATADLAVGIAGPFENYTRRSPELDAKYFAELASAGKDRAVRRRTAGAFERPGKPEVDRSAQCSASG